MLDVLCGVLLLVIGVVAGFYAGKMRARPTVKEIDLTDEQHQKELERQKRETKQVQLLLRYSGGAVNDDE